MTREEAIKCLTSFVEIRRKYCDMQTMKDEIECLEMAIEALEQEPCNDAISRQAVLDEMYRRKADGDAITVGFIRNLPSVNPQPKMGCEGCIYEKTGNNSTYPCSHCSRCYTDKYKAESEEQMNYKDLTLGDWISHISGVIEDETTLDGNEMRDLVKFLSTLEQEPRKGHWEHGRELNRVFIGDALRGINYEDWHCSNCHYVVEQSIKPKWSYCPNCRCRMVEPQERENKA